MTDRPYGPPVAPPPLPAVGPRPPVRGSVVAVVLGWRGRIGLFKRSAHVGHDAGRWHCITGYLDEESTAPAQALRELYEETGLSAADLVDLRPGPVLELADPRGGHWRVHTFHAETERRRLSLNWEHDAYRWVAPQSVSRFDGQVPWLHEVLRHLNG
ncbi:NUDIX domain-containing protein [Streptomyces cavernicola]|uniref:NUDIX domain-containing protein n=1 Tax=Streptomyces cavernicola TaxID=3043613 RepID=A0ABT6SE40_9ACTN|nr:NUDIX domain-containing protein [Streptomyces sp. B-S-A6]MDI3406458.1 NUDIX domain-containing protein [Streptomyces sp. B-S-A6]